MFSCTNQWRRPSAHLSPRWRIWWLWTRSCASCLNLRWILRYVKEPATNLKVTCNECGQRHARPPPVTPCRPLQHHSYRSFLGITCLMQISTREEDFIIDTLELRSEMYILNEAFTDPAIVKVIKHLLFLFNVLVRFREVKVSVTLLFYHRWLEYVQFEL